jgi:hypothetical protein
MPVILEFVRLRLPDMFELIKVMGRYDWIVDAPEILLVNVDPETLRYVPLPSPI